MLNRAEQNWPDVADIAPFAAQPVLIRAVEVCGDDDSDSIWLQRGAIVGKPKQFTQDEFVAANVALKARNANYRWHTAVTRG